MQKQTSKYDSPLDALIAVTKRLSIFEGKYGISTEDFFDKFSKGQMKIPGHLLSASRPPPGANSPLLW